MCTREMFEMFELTFFSFCFVLFNTLIKYVTLFCDHLFFCFFAGNLTTMYTHQMTSWTPSSGVVESGPTSAAERSSPPFKSSFTVRIPQQKVMFVPTVSEMLKFAWIQYLAVAFLVYVLATYSADFVFSYQVVETSSRLDTQYYGPKIHRF